MNNVRQNTDKNVPSKKKKNRFSNNTFVFVFSLIIAVVIWFVMAANNTLDRPRVIYDIPITIQTSNSAQEEGVKIFNMTNATVNVAVSGSSLVINKITTDDIKVVANFAPDTTKLLGNTMLTSTLTLETQKTNSNVTDFTIESVSPTQVTVTYDKYKEATFDIEDNIQYSTATNYYASTPSISQSTVTVSGPESSVNKISRASVDYKISDQIDSTKNFTAAITLYDSDEKVINPDTSYLTLSTNSVDCTINVLSKQTVKLDVNTLNMPEGFSNSRITIDPASIDIAGDKDTVSQYQTITLPTVIDFSNVNPTNNVFQMTIPMPSGVKNVSNVNQAEVTVNLSGYTQSTVTTQTFKFENTPSDETITVDTKSLPVVIVGSEAQVAKLTDSSIYASIDLKSYSNKTGSFEVPVTIGISGATNCWAYGEYTANITITAASETATGEESGATSNGVS